MTRSIRREVRARRLALVALSAALVVAGCADADADQAAVDDPLVVGAAADLRPAFETLAEVFTEDTGTPVDLTFGSSGQLAQQVSEGAPIELFASADAGFVDRVLDAGVGDADTRTTYAIGRIVVWSLDEDLAALDPHELADAPIETIAIANPDHAPYGRAAREALRNAGVWDEVEPRLVYGENIADTQRIAGSGNADVAIVALSLALAADEDDRGSWTEIDESLHEPLRQDLLVTADDPDRAVIAGAFADLVASEEGREVMARYGFVPPDDAAAAAVDGPGTAASDTTGAAAVIAPGAAVDRPEAVVAVAPGAAG